MARPIVLSNGELHVGLNKFGLVHEFYFPYVGLENHAVGKNLRHHIGVWVDGKISWFDTTGEWTFSFSYPSNVLVSHVVATNQQLGIRVEFNDFVDANISAFLRNIHIINLRDYPRDVRLFMHQAFVISDSRSNTDTVQYLPDSNAILHYRGRRAFIISGEHNNSQPFDQHTVGLFGIEGYEGTFRDAEDGELSFANVEHGRVDSTIRFAVSIDAHCSQRIHYWIAAGKSVREALYVHKQIREAGLDAWLHRTIEWWHDWMMPAVIASEKIPENHRVMFLRSIMILKSHIDKHGAIMASTDTSVLEYSRDAYVYMWPRDGAFIIWPLIRMGYTDEAALFFDFCKRSLNPNGYLMHKYRADGALGSSWHPYLHDGEIAPPIQEDETALVLFVFAQYYQLRPKLHILTDFYDSFVKLMANFLAGHVDETTGLPKSTYDLWEEVYLTTTYTTSVVYAALLAAADLASIMKDDDSAVKWRAAADDILTAAHKHLYNKERKAFYKGITVKNGKITYDSTIDTSSVFGAFMFGLYPTGSEELNNAVNSMLTLYGFNDNSLGIPRYENDRYYRVSENITGNWWFNTSLWLAQYFMETDDTEKGMRIIDWVQSCMLESGVLSEQISPIDGSQISVSPLAWSHAEYISTLLDTIPEAKPNN
jgi:GH15 family glucan-1,4-alpha-glucosidase